MPQPSANVYMSDSVSTTMFAIAGVPERRWCSSVTCLRSTAGSGSLPSAGTIWRLIAVRAVFAVFGLQRTATCFSR